MIAVADFMTKDLVTVRESDDVALAESLLRLGGIRHLPVVRDGRVVGLLTHRDVLRSSQSAKTAARDLPVRDVMTPDPVCVRATSSLAHAARLMLERKYGCLPVADDEGKLVGIVTEADFVRFAADVVRDLDLVAEAVRVRERQGDA
ncbi:CBS domain-containing protein [Anaeromyxobacter oryzae]|uniref:Membrane protein n=1 Tax=Anaeromyxobacter oryzae TaxID=2918170 RepID=A0ABM7X366_9BACT|nr:CBS domain-containing protein [Anaeromyxobacter oryzae]BDG06248.1 membrane protein [Anaeromyxobacter oryzae]